MVPFTKQRTFVAEMALVVCVCAIVALYRDCPAQKNMLVVVVVVVLRLWIGPSCPFFGSLEPTGLVVVVVVVVLPCCTLPI